MIKAILLSIHILLIVAVIFIERKKPTEALLWVFILTCMPYFGVILYLAFGSTMSIKLTAFLRKRRLQRHRPTGTRSGAGIPDASQLSELDRQVAHFNFTYNDSRLTCYDHAELFTSGVCHYERLFEDIKQARDCIFVEFYTIHHDRVGEAFANALAEKAREGVDVFVLCDFIANLSSPPKMFRPLTDAGGKLIRVKPYLTHYRSHRKIVSIDHQIAYIGGMNIGEQYANMAKVKNPWRDTQVRLTGACVGVLDQYFLTDWICSVKQRDWGNTVAYLSALTPLSCSPSPNLCQFIVGGADTNKESVKMCYLSMIRSARHRIRIQTPYFIPDASLLDALKTAAASGVDIQLMVPGIQASFFLDPVTTYYCGQLLEYGASVHKYQGYIHAKTMIIDSELCCIGSVNMDMRSLMVDDEICGVFYANELVERYNAIFDQDLSACTRYTWDQFLHRGTRAKLSESFFLLFAPLM